MADAIAARREARRKRILENSHNRLQFISGKIGNELPTETNTSSPVFNVCDNLPVDSCSSSKSLLYNGTLFSESETLQLLSPRHDDNATDDIQIANDLTALGSSSTDSAANAVPSTLERICLNRYDIVLLSLLIQVLYGVSATSLDGVYFFVPLVIYSVTKQLWFPTPPNPSIALAILFLNSLPRSSINKIMSIVQWLGVLSQDLCVFLFTTICIQSACIYISNMLIT